MRYRRTMHAGRASLRMRRRPFAPAFLRGGRAGEQVHLFVLAVFDLRLCERDRPEIKARITRAFGALKQALDTENLDLRELRPIRRGVVTRCRRNFLHLLAGFFQRDKPEYVSQNAYSSRDIVKRKFPVKLLFTSSTCREKAISYGLSIHIGKIFLCEPSDKVLLKRLIKP